MARYIEEESDTSRTVLITAGVVAGLLAGAMVAQRLGGWRGLRRLLAGRRAPLLKLLRGVIPSGTVGAVLDVVGIERIVSALLSEAPAERRSTRAERAAGLTRRGRRFDPELDEYEVDDFERAAAGLDEDEDEDEAPPVRALRARQDDGDEDELDDDVLEDEEDEIVEPPSPEAIEGAVLAAFRRHPVLRQRALEIAVDEAGVLELTGWVRSERELRIARRVAARVDGVEAVVVDVAVRDVPRGRPAATPPSAADVAADEDEGADTESSPA